MTSRENQTGWPAGRGAAILGSRSANLQFQYVNTGLVEEHRGIGQVIMGISITFPFLKTGIPRNPSMNAGPGCH